MEDRYTSEQALAAAAERLAIQQDRPKDAAAQIRRNFIEKGKERREAAGK